MVVEVQQGLLEGTEAKSVFTGKPYCCFLGIPYAEPPIGDLRFRPPVPHRKWEGVFHAKTEGSKCSQIESFFVAQKSVGSEDCLYLNVYTPKVSDQIQVPPAEIKTPKPVIVYIHGGAFSGGSGSPSTFSPDFIIDNEIIFVTINFRLHIFGFLNMNVPSCSGNCSLKDQVLALNWIKENIRSFGGDPENITLWGESSGSASVNLHMLSPASKGLFHKAILMSGFALGGWATIHNPTEQGFKVGAKLGFKGDDPEELVEFLKKQPAGDLTSAVFQIKMEARKEAPLGKIQFAPSVELNKENAFLPDLPENLIRTATPIPAILGLNNKEGMIFLMALNDGFVKKINEDLSCIIKHIEKCNPARMPETAAKAKKFYFGDKEIGPDKADALVDVNNQDVVRTIIRKGWLSLYTDLFVRRCYESLSFVSNSDLPLYAYEFAFDGKFNKFKVAHGTKFWKRVSGAAHSDALGYTLFAKGLFPQPQFEEPESTVIRNFSAILTNFATTGNPNTPIKVATEWKPSTNENPCFLRIDKDLQLVQGKIFGERTAFWNKLMDESQ